MSEPRPQPESTESESDAPPDTAPTSWEGVRAWWTWVWTTDRDHVVFFRELGQTLGLVVVILLLLFAVSGVWPPLVAVSSGSMEPHLERGDLVLIVEPGRYTGSGAVADTGIITAAAGAETGQTMFGAPGDVIVYQPDGHESPRVIHRAMLYVEAGENWYSRADPAYLGGADNCRELRYCPAPYAGFITKGDANPQYDQVGPQPISAPVKSSWIVGRSVVSAPYLGHIRLTILGSELGTVGYSDANKTVGYQLSLPRDTPDEFPS